MHIIRQYFQAYLDLVMCNIKQPGERKTPRFYFTVQLRILENIYRIGESGTNLIIRVPVIPTFNATEREILMIALFAAKVRESGKSIFCPTIGWGKASTRDWAGNTCFLP